VINLPTQLHETVTAIFEQLIAESSATERLSIDMIRALMLQLFILAARQSPDSNRVTAPSYNYTLLQNFRKLVDDNFITLKLPKEYAALLYITPNHLNALCNDMLGMPAGEVIRERVILEAKRALVNLELSITQIAGKLNFSDNSYFTKFFKKYTGLTPEEFRHNNLSYGNQ
jgi:AraC-like DNA-binding protein